MSYTDPQIGTLTISGDPARFVATERVPVSGLSMDFEPVQDLHGYEYPWPAGGGKNLYNPNGLTNRGVLSNGSFYINTKAVLSDYIEVLPNTTYTASVNSSFYAIAVSEYDENKGWIKNTAGSSNVTSRTITTGSTTKFIMVFANFDNTNDLDVSTFASLYHPQLEQNSTATSFAPYSNICPIIGRDSVTVYVSPEPSVVDGTEEHEIEFGQTVYAGTLTINEDGSGTIVITHARTDLGTLTWNYLSTGSTNYLYANLALAYKVANSETSMISDIYRVIPFNDRSASYTFFTFDGNNRNLQARNTGYTDGTTFKTDMTGHYLVYKLAEPVTIQLDPIEITTLIGLNYVWTSDHNLITITFPYNKEVQPMALTYEHCWTYPKAYIDKLEARIAALETAASAAAAEAAAANTAAALGETRETVAEEITVTEEPETEPVTKKGGK